MKRSYPILGAVLGGLVVVVLAVRLLWDSGSETPSPADNPTTVEDQGEALAGASGQADRPPVGESPQPQRVAEQPEVCPETAGRPVTESPAVTYRASGRVVEEASGKPVAGAWVRAYREPPPLTIFDIKNAIGQDLGQLWQGGAEQSYRPDLESKGSKGNALKTWQGRAFVETRSGEDGSFVLAGIPAPVFHLSAFEPMGFCLEPPYVHVTHGTEITGLEMKLSIGGMVRGRVLTPDGQPASHAQVSLGQAFDPFQAIGGRMTLRVPGTAQTDAEGRFAFTAVPGPATYLVTASLEPFGRPETARVEIRPGLASECELRLTAAGRCEVTVQDPAGNHVPQAQIKIQPTRVEFDEMMLRQGQFNGRQVVTDAGGRVVFEGLDPGPYRLKITHSDYMQYTEKKISINANETTECPVVLQPGMELTGRVVDTQDAPVKDARVRAHPKPSLTDMFSFGEAYETPWVHAGGNGRFTLRGLPDETLVVEAKADDYAQASIDAHPGDQEVTLRLNSLAAIEGTVVSRVTGDVIKTFMVRVETKRGFSLDFSKMGVDMLFDRPIPFHSPDGRFRMKGLENGRYRLEVSAEGHAAKKSDWIDVKDGEGKKGLLFYLGPEGAIEGVVVDAADGNPVAGVQVHVKTGAGNPITEMVGSIFQDLGPTTGEDGRYRIGGLSTGTYRLAAKHPSYAGASINDVRVTEGQVTTDVTISLDRGGEIYGGVYDASGQPVAEARIFCNNSSSTRFRSTSSAKDGTYTLTGLAPGSYVVTLFPGNLSLGSEDFMSKVTEGLHTQSVTLEKGGHVQVDFHQGEKGGGVVAGRVTQKGAGVKGAIVSVISQGEAMPGQGQSSAHTAITGENGAFRIERIQPGRAVLQAQKMVDPFGGMMGAQVREITVQPSGVTSVTVELPTAEIHGVVKDAGTGGPLAGVTVYASIKGAEKEQVGLLAFSKSYAAMARSDGEGRFTLIDLAAGRYTLNAGGMDLFGLSATGHAITRVENIDVEDGRILEIPPIRMPEAAVVEGTVKDTAGNPVSGASIFLRRMGTDEDFLQRFTVVSTDTSGYFSYGGVPEGHYDVLCRSTGRAAAVEHGVAAVAGTTARVTLKLDRGTAVFVILEDVPITELADLDVELTGPEGRIPLGLMGISDLAGMMFQFPEPGVYGLGTFAPGAYRVKGSFSGKSFERDFTLKGEPELRFKVNLK